MQAQCIGDGPSKTWGWQMGTQGHRRGGEREGSSSSSVSLTVGLYLMGVAQDVSVRGRVVRLKPLACSAWAGSRQVDKGHAMQQVYLVIHHLSSCAIIIMCHHSYGG